MVSQEHNSMSQNAVLGIIGTGNLAGFLVAGLRHVGDDRKILLSPYSPKKAEALASEYSAQVAQSDQAVADGSDIVVIATPPPRALDTIRSIKWRADQVIICVAIDNYYEALAAAAAPAKLVRALPTSAAATGGDVAPVYPGNAAAVQLLSRLGKVVVVESEKAFGVASTIAVYHLWLYGLMDAVVTTAIESGLSKDGAIDLVTQHTEAVGRAARLAPRDGPLRQTLDQNAAPGSQTLEGLEVLNAGNAFSPWRAALLKVLSRGGGAS